MQKYTYIVKRANNETDLKDAVSFVASTAASDRYGDIINVKGWKLDNYKKNPVILLNHDTNSLPIGKGDVFIRNDKLIVNVQFDEEDPKAKEVKRKAKNGFMNAVSVGFRPLKAQSRSDLPKDNKYYGTKGMYYSEAELLEVSIVTIPANGEATMLEQKFYNNLKNELLVEIKSIIQENMFVNKHILNVKEEDDRYIVEFAKLEKEIEEAMEEEEEKEMKEDEEEKEMEEEETESYHDDEDEKKEEDEEEKEDKSFNDLIEAFAYIINSK